MSKLRLLPIVALLAFGAGCEALGLFGAADSPEITIDADKLVKSGDLPAAHDKYEEIWKANQSSVYAAMGLAYSHYLKGEYGEADKILAKMDTDKLGVEIGKELRLRRTLIAVRQGDLKQVISLGQASGTPIGKLLAAEGHFANTDINTAIPLFEDASQAGGKVGATAKQYLEYIRSDDSVVRSLAEASALWAIGDRETACESAKDTLAELDEDFPNRNEIALLWAGRAATSAGDVGIAEELLERVGVPPEGQAWRIQATQALIHFRNEEFDDGVGLFRALASGGAPADGLADAIATAAAISGNLDIAKEITAGLESNATARGLWEAGDREGAAELAPAGRLQKFLENGG